MINHIRRSLALLCWWIGSLFWLAADALEPDSGRKDQ